MPDHSLYERAKQAGTEFSQSLQAGRGEYPEPGKSGQVKCGCSNSDDTSGYIVRLRSDLANTYYWYGNFCLDYIFFIAQWHPLLGIFFSHPDHPWTKGERLRMFIISLCITMLPSAVIARYGETHQSDPLVKAEVMLLTILFVTIPDTIIGIILYQLSIANTRCPACATLWNCINKACHYGFLAVFAVQALIIYLVMVSLGVQFTAALKTLGIGKLISFGTWFPLWFVLPCVGFAHEWYMEWKTEASKKEEGAEEEE